MTREELEQLQRRQQMQQKNVGQESMQMLDQSKSNTRGIAGGLSMHSG